MRQPIRRRTLAAAILATSAPAVAATVDWLPTAPSPAPFFDAANWSTGTAPTSADAARFDTGSAHTAALTADVTTKQLVVANDTLTLDLAGHNYTLSDPGPSSYSLLIGSATTSSLTVTSSTTPALLKANIVHLSDAATDSASLALTGPVSLAVNPPAAFTVGTAGRATVDLSAGATLTTANGYLSLSTGSSGSATLDGPGTTWTSAANIFAGYRGTGSLTVRNGAAVSVASELDLAYYASSTGTVTVRDPASSLAANAIYVGGSSAAGGGTGTLNIESGSVTANTLKLWNTKTSALNLSGGSLKIAYADPTSDLSRFHWTGGTLELTNSAFQVSNPTTVSPALNYIFNAGPAVSLTTGMSLKVASRPSSSHYLVIDNGGTLTADNASISVGDTAFIGYAATGTLTLTNHAAMSSPAGTIGYYTTRAPTLQRGTGYVTLDDHASWTLTGDLAVGGDGGGTLAIRGASAVSNANATIAAGPIASSATVDGPSSSWSSSGTLTVGKLGQGTLTIANGGTASSASAIIASSYVPDSSVVTVEGTGSSWTNTSTLYVAGGQLSNTSRTPASLSLSDHASVTTRTLAVGTNSTSATGSITLASGATLSVTTSAYLGGITTSRGTATLSLTDSSATVGNTLTLWNTPNTSLSLTRSTLTIGTPAAAGSLDNAASISLADHSTLTLHGTLANAGTVSLSPDSLLLWDPISAPDPLATLRTQLATGHIIPSPTVPANYRPAYTFSGEPTAPMSLTITLALTGDTNLDGRLNADDYALLDRALAKSTTDAHWTDGDFNYDGIIDNQDYLLIDTAFCQAQGLSPQFLSLRESQFGPTYIAALLTSIPEPSSLACLFAGFLLPRRRTR